MPKHTNPEFATKLQKNANNQTYHTYLHAHAPYNFIPLPIETISVDTEIPKHDQYTSGLHTGWIDYDFETVSPTYIRGALKREVYDTLREGNLTVDEKELIAPFFFQDAEDILNGHPRPSIPGSSLRGMVRSLMEIILHTHPRWVDDQSMITFRDVANEPLRTFYQKKLGIDPNNRNSDSQVKAGYLQKVNNGWMIIPAQKLSTMGLSANRNLYKLRIRENRNSQTTNQLALEIKTAADTQEKVFYKDLMDPEYQPACVPVSFSVINGQVDHIDIPGSLSKSGWVVCSDNMSATGQYVKTGRTHYILIPQKSNLPSIPILPQAIQEYLQAMTPFIRDELKAWSDGQGVLGDGKPVFYLTDQITKEDGSTEEVVRFFGHCPNFRIPAIPAGMDHAVSPADFIPQDLLQDSGPDMVDALFGWVKEKSLLQSGERAGRLSFENARYKSKQGEASIWYSQNPIPLEILAGPKPTTFQHYLVQDRELGHNPDQKASLATYCTSPNETAIRGSKYYWMRGSSPKMDFQGNNDEMRKVESQLTRVIPVRKEVSFSGRIHFENLSAVELGALCWVLSLPGEQGKTYCHRIGMGKPLGMGAIQIQNIQVSLTDRDQRYQELFSVKPDKPDDAPKLRWHAPVDQTTDLKPYIQELENFLGCAERGLQKEPRVSTLLLMLEKRDDSDGWWNETSYMKIEAKLEMTSQDNGIVRQMKMNEYKERPVLPTPEEVIKWHETPPSSPD